LVAFNFTSKSLPVFQAMPVTEDIGGGAVPQGNSTICGSACDFEQLWHPYVLLFITHCAAAALATFLSLKFPKALIWIMALSGLAFPISAIFGLPMWQYTVVDFYWWGVFIKWVIVNALATIPVVIIKANNLTAGQMRCISILVYVILGSNVVWTMFAVHEGHLVRFVNRGAGTFLTLALTIHCVALCRHGYKLVDVNPKSGFPYGYGTPLPWLICYTVWNVLFIIQIATGSTLQDILFWAIMYAYWYVDKPRKPIELYFLYGRPVQLGSYIAHAEWMGTFVPYFRDAETLKETHPLDVNGNAYIFFISLANFVWSLVVTYWSVKALVKGFEKNVPINLDEEFAPQLSDSEDSYDDEEESENRTLKLSST
jgi:hypothetical protein